MGEERVNLPVFSDGKPIGIRVEQPEAEVEGIDPRTSNYGSFNAFAPRFKDRLDALQRGEVVAPIHVRIKPTNICNHSCFYCTYADRKGGSSVAFSAMHGEMNVRNMLPREKLMEVLDDLKDMGVKAVTYSGGGEPLLYPYIADTLERTLNKGLDLSIITHGQFLMEPRATLLRHAKWVRVSQDATDPETFNAIRGNGRVTQETFRKIQQSVGGFANVKDSTCELGINFVVSELNWRNIYESAKMWKELGVNRIRFSPVWSPELIGYHAPFKKEAEEQIARAKTDFDDGKFKVFSSYSDAFRSTGLPVRHYGQCFIMQINPAIGADQNVYFCHNKAYDESGKLGSISGQSFRQLWYSSGAAQKFREFDPRIYCKHECTGDLKNVAMNQAFANPQRRAKLTELAAKTLDPIDNFI